MTRPVPAGSVLPHTIEPLSGRLPRVTADAARLSRLAFDRRFQQWLERMVDVPALKVTDRPAPANWRLSLDTAQGRLHVHVDTAEWPALQLALALDDEVAACAVATVLLEPLTAVWAALHGPIVVAARAPLASNAGQPAAVEVGPVRVGLRAFDPALVQQLETLIQGVPGPDISAFAPLPLRARLRLLQRTWAVAVVQSLRTGDVVLAGAHRGVLICGVGHTLQAAVHIHPKDFTVQVAQDPHMTTDDVALQDTATAGGGLEDLQLPVAFELDTARISLAELASMRPGYAVELDVPLQEAVVRLVCHGQTIGHGQLVAIGDQLGVRITRMEYTHDTPVTG